MSPEQESTCKVLTYFDAVRRAPRHLAPSTKWTESSKVTAGTHQEHPRAVLIELINVKRRTFLEQGQLDLVVQWRF